MQTAPSRWLAAVKLRRKADLSLQSVGVSTARPRQAGAAWMEQLKSRWTEQRAPASQDLDSWRPNQGRRIHPEKRIGIRIPRGFGLPVSKASSRQAQS